MARTHYFILILIIASGCLQNPATIDGANNYYLENVDTKVRMNRERYRHIDPKHDDFQFEDEKASKKPDTFNPYKAPSVDNLMPDDDAITIEPSDTNNLNAIDSDMSKKSQAFKIEEPNGDIDWDDLFHDVKNQKIDTKSEPAKQQSTMQNGQKETEKPLEKKNSNVGKTKIIESNKKNQLNSGNSDVSTKKVDKIIPKPNATPVVPTKNPLCCIAKPTNGEIVTRYGKAQNSELDDGMTFKISDKTVKSAGDGKVIYVDGENSSHKTVIVKHNNGIISSYSYNGSVKTAVNKEIKSGQIIGEVANDKNILYFTTRHNGKTIDPEKIMK